MFWIISPYGGKIKSIRWIVFGTFRVPSPPGLPETEGVSDVAFSVHRLGESWKTRLVASYV